MAVKMFQVVLVPSGPEVPPGLQVNQVLLTGTQADCTALFRAKCLEALPGGQTVVMLHPSGVMYASQGRRQREVTHVPGRVSATGAQRD